MDEKLLQEITIDSEELLKLLGTKGITEIKRIELKQVKHVYAQSFGYSQDVVITYYLK